MATTLSRFKGGRELQDFLNTLPAKIERNIMRSALRAGANVVLKEARDNINSRSGDLAKSLKVGTRSRRGQVTATVKTELYYAKFVEFGTSAHVIGPKEGVLDIGGKVVASVKHPGAKPHPFMRPAIDEKRDEAIRAVGEQIRKRLTKEGINAPAGVEVGDE